MTYWEGLGEILLGVFTSSLVFLTAFVYRYRPRLREVVPSAGAPHIHTSHRDVRIAWLIPSLDRGYYWQPILREFTRHFPDTVVFTGIWPGFLTGLEGTFSVRHLRGLKFVTLKPATKGTESSITWLPLSIVGQLLRFRPRVVFVSGFNLWSLYALLFKAFTWTHIILLWDGISPAVGYARAPIRLRIRRVMARFFDGCISNSREGVDYLRTVLGVPDLNLRQYPYQVPSIDFLQERSLSAGAMDSCPSPRFLYVGRLIEPKGIQNLLLACSLLKNKGLGPFSTVIVGDGAQKMALRDLASKLGLDDQIHWAGEVGYRELGTYYRACDIFVFPTQEDIWGVVPLEAMAFGKPILCSKYAGSKELVRHGQNGFVFDPFNHQSLAQYMARFLREPQLIKSFGAMSEQVIAQYTPKSAANVLATTVASVLDRRLHSSQKPRLLFKVMDRLLGPNRAKAPRQKVGDPKTTV